MNEGTKLYPFILDDSEPGDELDSYKPAPPPQATMKEEEDEEEHCSICLQPLSDRTIIPACSHEFCFECLLVWTEQSRRCPLCSGQIGEYLIHDIRSKYDFSKHYLNPLRSSPRPDPPVSRVAGTRRRGQGREAVWGRNERRERERERRAADELDRAIEKRRWIYRHNLYAMHVASNPYTRYKPFPTPAQFASNPDLISRATIFVRRELRVWDALDVEFLTTFTISLMKSIDIRSESAVKLLAEFLDMDTGERTNAEHFAHELYCYLRSPYRDLVRYDAAVQYDTPEHVPAVAYRQRSNRWEDDGIPHSPNTLGDAGPSNIHGGTPARSHSQQESRDAVRESSKERKERSTPRSPEVQEVHRVGLGDHRRLSIGTSDHRKIPQNIKGKGRAIDEDGDSPLTSRPVQEQDSTVAMLETETSHPAQKDATTTATVADEAPVIHSSHESSTSKQRDRPKVRREALQAMNAHLLHPSRGYRTTKPVIDREQQTPDTSARDELPPLTELSIRGAAKATAQVSPAPSFPSPESVLESNCQSAHDATRVPTDVQGMSSRDIMARTRARLAKLRQDSTLSTSTTSPKRGDHDVLGLDASSKFPNTPHTTEDGNHTAPSSSNFLSDSIVAQSHEASAAQSSHPSTTPPRSDVEGATATPTSLRAKLLKKLEDEKRAHDDDHDNNAHHPDTSAVVVAEGSQFQTSRVPDNIGGSKQGQTEEELSLGRQDAEMLEKKLRGQAQLRIKLAAAKRQLAEAALGADEMSNVDHNPMSREDYLRSRLKRAA